MTNNEINQQIQDKANTYIGYCFKEGVDTATELPKRKADMFYDDALNYVTWDNSDIPKPVVDFEKLDADGKTFGTDGHSGFVITDK